jgi:hypothetical protein
MIAFNQLGKSPAIFWLRLTCPSSQGATVLYAVGAFGYYDCGVNRDLLGIICSMLIVFRFAVRVYWLFISEATDQMQNFSSIGRRLLCL